ncbi:NACHT domain-containing protein [Fusarium redolens]|uniref:NACHT domain-containing protein n=1 Tax=Fusarium redolens TaxID=48865 RepID=A0A9P9G457_FUSRE|nr:NACHT domain-containing protein [Fusarium redolens]KAH7232186.1 NACHT domain-containing protein [Fusarium redolens]
MPFKNDKDKSSLASRSPNHTLMSRLRLEEPEDTRKIELAKLFDPVKIDKIEKHVRRVLIYGRAGIGKTTLCKKIVHEFKQGRLWKTNFDRLLWIPLRELSGLKGQQATLETVLKARFFKHGDHHQELAKRIGDQLKLEKFKRTLFLLDSLDEVASNLDDSNSISLLQYLINSPNVIITSRPHFGLPTYMSPFDIEVEVVGLALDQVDDYIEKSTYDSPEEIRKFLRMNKLVRDLPRIPIQLEAPCHTWNLKGSKWDETGPPRSMTDLYQAMEIKLAQKDLESGNPQDQNNASGRSRGDVKKESTKFTNFLKALAFAGMCLGEVNFDNGFRDMIRPHFGDQYCVDDALTLQGLSFLRSSSSSPKERVRDYASFYFLHLTYQEYFAAQYFVQQWLEKKPLIVLSSDRPRSRKEASVEEFLHENKYLPAFDVFWRFVCGLLPQISQTEFFTLVSQRPDILGLAHQRLIMHCLVEAKPTFEVQYHLQHQLGNWAYFQLCQEGSDSKLAEEAEFPESAIHRILTDTTFSDACMILDVLSNRDALSSSVLAKVLHRAVIDRKSMPDWSLGISILAKSSLPESLISTILKSAAHADTRIAHAAIELLARQQLLSRLSPEILQRYAQNTSFSSDMSILRNSSSLEVFLPYLPSWRQSEDRNLRWALIRHPCKSNLLEAKAREDLLKPRRDDDMLVRGEIRRYLQSQKFLPDEMLKIAVELLAYDAVSEPDSSSSDDRQARVERDIIRLLHCHQATLRPIYTELLRSSPKASILYLSAIYATGRVAFHSEPLS